MKFYMGKERLELSTLAGLAPKASVYTNSTTYPSAHILTLLDKKFKFLQEIRLFNRISTAQHLDINHISWNPVFHMKYFLFALAFLCIPSSAHAAMMITTVEYGNPGANDELIVITNDGSAPVDISSWSLQAKNSSSNTMQKKNFVAGTIVDAGASYVVANKDGRFAPQAQMTYTSLSLANTGGTLALVKNTTYLSSFDELSIAHSVTYGPLTPTTPAIATTTPSTTSTSTAPTTKSVSAVQEFIGIIPTTKESWPIIISELLPKPINEDEYIEIQNTSSEAVDVSGLWLSDASGSTYALGARGENTLLGAGEFRAWKRATTRIALNDTDGDVVILQSQSGATIDRIVYMTDALAGAAYARFGKSLLWTISPTRSDKNYFTAIQSPPIARAVIPYSAAKVGEIISVSAEDSTDPNDSIQKYLWDFGDGATYTTVTTTHSFESAGVYTITLTVTDSFGATSSVSRDVSVTTPNPLRISAAGFISAAAVAPTKTTSTPKKAPATKAAVVANPQYSGTVSIPPGILGKRKFVVNGRTVEVTSDRKELPRLQPGSVISFTAQEILRSERLVLQVTVKDPITVTALSAPPPFDVLTGEVTAVSKTGFDLTTSSTDYAVLAGTRYQNGEKIKVGDVVRAEGILLRDDSIEQTFVIPNASQLQYLDTTIKKTTTKSQLAILAISVSALIGLQLFSSLAVPRIKKLVTTKLKKDSTK